MSRSVKRTALYTLIYTCLCMPVDAATSIVRPRFTSFTVSNPAQKFQESLPSSAQINLRRDAEGTITDGVTKVLGDNHTVITEFAFGILSIDPQNTQSVQDAITTLQSEPKLNQEALVFPSPFKLGAPNVKLGFGLSKDLDIEVRIYDMRGNEIFREFHPQGTPGGKEGYNVLIINRDTFRYDLSVGAYFFLIIHNKEVLGKGKFAVIP